MKKFSTKSFKEMQIVRDSDDYKSLMSKAILITDLAQQAGLDSFIFRVLMNVCNLKSADLFGYTDERDYPDFIGQIKGNREELNKWLECNPLSPYAADVRSLLEDVDAVIKDDEEND